MASVGTRFVAATTRTSTWISDLPPPTRRKLPSWSTRRSLACVLESISAISSRNNVPPSASSKQPSRRSAALVTEQLALDQRLGDRRTVDGDERTIPPVGQVVDRARDELLAGAALTIDQHRGGAGRRELDPAIDLLHAA